MKFFIAKFLLTAFIFFVALGAGVAYFGFVKFKTPATIAAEKLVIIPKGSGTMMIADILKSQNIISDPYVFAAVSKTLPPKDTLKAGEYQFSPHVKMQDVILKIKNGETYKRQFTIPEGLTSYEILERLKSVPDIQLSDISIPKEGSLLPDTYQYERNERLDTIILRMTSAQQKVIEKEWPLRDKNLPFATSDEAVILASIVEKETGVPSERARIAGVFINRLRQGIPLQTDPTVIYALTNGQPKNNGQAPLGRRLLLKDLQIDSTYNTYKNTGLPPTPIANAGKDAILAALHPESHNFLFFVADGTGGHIFAKTLAEHNQNVANWRLLRQNRQ